MKKHFWMLLLPALILTSFGSSTASANSVQTFKDLQEGVCLSGSTTNVNLGRCSNERAKWIVHHWQDNTVELRSKSNSNYCLDDSNAYGTRMFPCNATPWQSWYVDRPGDGSIILRNQANNQCLTSYRPNMRKYYVSTESCDGSDSQKWY
ncbi:ricin-type beta-trefoil lectin domain protein [Alkalihalobacillus sp. TS-13]|uniref:RICIN domain-containing protein n=1 Tax=Alkalihalobacillus sp. TS-13 TaxID=2842455 RepID=UPI001C86FC9E|nr:ricin-type beta-trefoil lectin domain protein [Alkalihalobacillus sp. TS-13]